MSASVSPAGDFAQRNEPISMTPSTPSKGASLPMTTPEAIGVHTAGPWERLEGIAELGHPIYKPGTVVTRIVQKRLADQTDFVKVALVDTGAANACLIASAPDLLEALQDAVDDLLTSMRFRGDGWGCSEEELIGKYRAAIARATGAA